MKPHPPLYKTFAWAAVVSIVAMVFCALFLIIPLICIWTIFDDLAVGNLAAASLKLMVSAVSAGVGIFLAFITVRLLRSV